MHRIDEVRFGHGKVAASGNTFRGQRGCLRQDLGGALRAFDLSVEHSLQLEEFILQLDRWGFQPDQEFYGIPDNLYPGEVKFDGVHGGSLSYRAECTLCKRGHCVTHVKAAERSVP